MNIIPEPIDQLLVAHRCTCRKADRTLHTHSNAYEIMLFKSGNVDYFINDIAYQLKPGDLTFVCPNDIHGFFAKDNSPYERMPIHFEEGFAASLSTANTDLFHCFHTFSKDRPYHLNKKQMEEYENCTDTIINSLSKKEFGYDIRIRACLSQVMLLANSAQQSSEISMTNVSPKIIQDALTYINENLTKDISIQIIADHLSISQSRLSHLFKDFTGSSLWNYIIARRIQYAQLLLRQGHSITTACYECGFRDYSHFAKLFSKITGISPGKFARNLQSYKKDIATSELCFE